MKKVTALALLLGMSIFTFAQESEKNSSGDEKKSDSPMYRTWSVGLDLGGNWLLGDMYSAESGKLASNDDFGKAGIDVSLSLAKWINSAFGVQGQLGWGKYSGTRDIYAIDASAMRTEFNVLMNLNGFGARNRAETRKDAWIFHTGIGMNFANAQIYRNGENPFELGQNSLFYFFDREKGGETHHTWYIPFGLEWRYRITPRIDLSVGATGVWFTDDNADGSITLVTDGSEFRTMSARELATIFPNTTNDFLFRLNVGINYFFAWKSPKNDDVIIYTDALSEINKRVTNNEKNIGMLMADEDKDGVSDYFDKEKDTPEGALVTGAGQALDTDGDGIPDGLDEDPYSTKGAVVGTNGRELDDDGDGVPNGLDLEPNTPKGSFVNFQGVTIEDKIGGGASSSDAFLPNIYFDFNKSNVTSANYERLAVVARFMENNKNVKLRAVGHTDKVGTESYNFKLSDRRAAAAINALVNDFGIDRSRFEADGKGKSQLWSKRDDINRRVEFQVVRK